LKFSEIGDGPLFLIFGGRLVIGGRDYIDISHIHTDMIRSIERERPKKKNALVLGTSQLPVRWTRSR
jgi:hypothetical protein